MQLLKKRHDAGLADALLDPAEVNYKTTQNVRLLLIGVPPDTGVEPVFVDDIVCFLVRLHDFSSVFHYRPPHSFDIVIVFELQERLLVQGEGLTLEDVLLDDVLAALLITMVALLGFGRSVTGFGHFGLSTEASFEPFGSHQFEMDTFCCQCCLIRGGTIVST